MAAQPQTKPTSNIGSSLTSSHVLADTGTTTTMVLGFRGTSSGQKGFEKGRDLLGREIEKSTRYVVCHSCSPPHFDDWICCRTRIFTRYRLNAFNLPNSKGLLVYPRRAGWRLEEKHVPNQRWKRHVKVLNTHEENVNAPFIVQSELSTCLL